VDCEPDPARILEAIKAGKAVVKGRPLATHEMALIGYKVVGRGYMKWIDYKRSRGYHPLP
jgi:hypothetical protein